MNSVWLFYLFWCQVAEQGLDETPPGFTAEVLFTSPASMNGESGSFEFHAPAVEYAQTAGTHPKSPLQDHQRRYALEQADSCV